MSCRGRFAIKERNFQSPISQAANKHHKMIVIWWSSLQKLPALLQWHFHIWNCCARKNPSWQPYYYVVNYTARRLMMLNTKLTVRVPRRRTRYDADPTYFRISAPFDHPEWSFGWCSHRTAIEWIAFFRHSRERLHPLFGRKIWRLEFCSISMWFSMYFNGENDSLRIRRGCWLWQKRA